MFYLLLVTKKTAMKLVQSKTLPNCDEILPYMVCEFLQILFARRLFSSRTICYVLQKKDFLLKVTLIPVGRWQPFVGKTFAG